MNLPLVYANMLMFPKTIDEMKNRMHRFENEFTIFATTTVMKVVVSAAPTCKPDVSPLSAMASKFLF